MSCYYKMGKGKVKKERWKENGNVKFGPFVLFRCMLCCLCGTLYRNGKGNEGMFPLARLSQRPCMTLNLLFLSSHPKCSQSHFF